MRNTPRKFVRIFWARTICIPRKPAAIFSRHASFRRELKLDEETRWQITGEIEGLRQHGEWEWLDEEAPMRALAPGSGPHDRREKIKPE